LFIFFAEADTHGAAADLAIIVDITGHFSAVRAGHFKFLKARGADDGGCLSHEEKVVRQA
jgi:hypothetical protein